MVLQRSSPLCPSRLCWTSCSNVCTALSICYNTRNLRKDNHQLWWFICKKIFLYNSKVQRLFWRSIPQSKINRYAHFLHAYNTKWPWDITYQNRLDRQIQQCILWFGKISVRVSTANIPAIRGITSGWRSLTTNCFSFICFSHFSHWFMILASLLNQCECLFFILLVGTRKINAGYGMINIKYISSASAKYCKTSRSFSYLNGI